jgi:hypothetical protein
MRRMVTFAALPPRRYRAGMPNAPCRIRVEPASRSLFRSRTFWEFLHLAKGNPPAEDRELLDIGEIENTLVSIRECGREHHERCEDERRRRSRPSRTNPPGLAGRRIDELCRLLNTAANDQPIVGRTNPWFKLLGVLLQAVLIGIPLWLIAFLGWGNDLSSLRDAASFWQAYSGFVAVAVSLFAAWLILWLLDRQRRRDWCLRRLTACRSFIQLVDSHLLAKSFGPHWEHPRDPERVGGALKGGVDEVYRDPGLAIQYLNLAGQEVRCCARIAALYGQWLSEDADVVAQSEMLLQLALDIERNALLKADLIREAARDAERTK